MLLGYKVDINLCLKNSKYSFLYIVCENGNKKIVELLLNNGVNVNLCIEDGLCFFYIVC